MFNLPYVYRHSRTSSVNDFLGELPAKICGVDQKIWMTTRRDTLSGSTGGSNPPCLSCVVTWKGQSIYNNSATLLNSSELSGNTGYWPDYWTGDTTTNYVPFISFDGKDSSPNKRNSLNIPYNSSFGKLTEFTFSTIFRTRRISPNITTNPHYNTSSNVVLFQHGNDTSGSRLDGWGIDVQGGAAPDELRIWYKHNSSSIASCIGGGYTGNGVAIPVNDWTQWIRLTIRVSGNTMQTNIYNVGEFAANTGFTWTNGCNNGSGTGISYTMGNPDWFIAAQKGTGWPSSVVYDEVILAGSWDILEYVLYDKWLPDPCVGTIWKYFDTRYNIPFIS